MTPEAASSKYPNIFKINPEDGILEIYCDNHILSSYRKCPGFFVESIINNRQTTGRNWSLEFGKYFHNCMEYFYQAQRDNWEKTWPIDMDIAISQNLENFMKICGNYWHKYDLNYFSQDLWYDKKSKKNIPHPSFTKLGGYIGAFNLFLQYYNTHFQQERLRVVGTELSFGRAKEVPIVEYSKQDIQKCEWIRYFNFNAYYCGRIDLLVDDGNIIGPMDHKTTSYFDGTEGNDFKPHDGMQGYVFAAQKMIPKESVEQGRLCNSIFINHICLTNTGNDPTNRFKRSIKTYTPAEMSEWQSRQVRTFTDIYRTVILEEPVFWNTENCNGKYGYDCMYKELHNLPPLSREVYAKTNFVTNIKQWSHENV